MRGSRTLAVLLVLGGGLLAVLAAGRTWLTVLPAASAVTTAPVPVTGREAAPGAAALGLVALAGAVALLAAGPLVRRLVAALVGLCAAGLVAVTVDFRAGVPDLARDAVARATGVTVAAGEGVTSRTTPWPLVSAAAGLLVVAGAVVVVVRAGRWSGPSRRYEAVPATGAPSPATGRAAPAPGVAGAAAERDRAYDAWEALSAGGDPTDEPPRR